jgi:hypothetical protein
MIANQLKLVDLLKQSCNKLKKILSNLHFYSILAKLRKTKVCSKKEKKKKLTPTRLWYQVKPNIFIGTIKIIKFPLCVRLFSKVG